MSAELSLGVKSPEAEGEVAPALRIVPRTAAEIECRLRKNMERFRARKVVAHAFTPLGRDISFASISNTPIIDLLIPKSTDYVPTFEETEQRKITEALLGDSMALLDLTPRKLLYELESKPWDGSFLDIRPDHTYFLTLLTTAVNDQTGKRLYSSWAIKTVGKRSVVDVMQRFHSNDASVIELQGQVLRGK
jgi:hypothetical protein